jgi:hypothetical protein
MRSAAVRTRSSVFFWARCCWWCDDVSAQSLVHAVRLCMQVLLLLGARLCCRSVLLACNTSDNRSRCWDACLQYHCFQFVSLFSTPHGYSCCLCASQPKGLRCVLCVCVCALTGVACAQVRPVCVNLRPEHTPHAAVSKPQHTLFCWCQHG